MRRDEWVLPGARLLIDHDLGGLAEIAGAYAVVRHFGFACALQAKLGRQYRSNRVPLAPIGLQRFPQKVLLQEWPKQTIVDHEELFGPSELVRLGAYERCPKCCSSVEYGPACQPRKLNSAAVIKLTHYRSWVRHPMSAIGGKAGIDVKGLYFRF